MGTKLLARLLPALALAACLGAAVAIASADNTDQNNSGVRYAWGENVGWLKARPAAEAYGPGGTGMHVTDTDVTGYLWGENIGWVNLSCKNNGTCGGTAGSWGIKNDGAGNLSGLAWAENAGWINFSCATNSACGGAAGNWGVRIQDYTVNAPHATAGKFIGEAWGENLGWINFSCATNSACGGSAGNWGVQTGAPDSDGDGYTDTQEQAITKNPFAYCPAMRADVNGDAKVTILDLSLVAGAYNEDVPPASARLDQNGDGKITILDLSLQGGVYNEGIATACP